MPAKNFDKNSTNRFIVRDYNSSGTVIGESQDTEQILLESMRQSGTFGKKILPLKFATGYTTYQKRETLSFFESRVWSAPGGYLSRTVSNRSVSRLSDPGQSFRPALSSGTYNSALSKLRVELHNRATWDMGVFLAELPKTSMLAVDAMTGLADLLGNIGRNRRGFLTVSGSARAFKSLSSLWLFYRYGLMPAILDLQSMTKALQKSAFSFDGRVKIKSPKVSDLSRSSFKTSSPPAKVEYLDKVMMWYLVSITAPGSYIDLVKRFADQTGLTNPAVVLYELTRLSFVVDWFLDIGGWLAALQTPIGFNFQEIVRCDFRRRFSTINPNFSGVINGQPVVFSGSTLSRDEIWYEREILSQWPTPRLPSFDLNMNPQRVLDAMALLSGNFLRATRA